MGDTPTVFDAGCLRDLLSMLRAIDIWENEGGALRLSEPSDSSRKPRVRSAKEAMAEIAASRPHTDGFSRADVLMNAGGCPRHT